MESIDAVKRMIGLHPKTFQFVTSTKEFKKAYRNRRVASMMGMEGGQMIGNSMAALRTFYDLGVRYMTVSDLPFSPPFSIDIFSSSIVDA
jgi:membrane dipeptidase